MTTIDLDTSELFYLIESCLLGSHLRSTTIRKFIDEVYDKLSQEDRKTLYNWVIDIIYNGKYKESSRCCGMDNIFIARYNPDNQYHISTEYNNKIVEYDAFLYEGHYHISSSSFIADDFIKEIKKIKS